MWIKRLHIVLVLAGAFICTVAAREIQQTGAPQNAAQSGATQEATQTGATVSVTGEVRTAEGIPVPGASLRVIQPSTGKAWLSWTAENGKFQFPAVPEDHLRLEFSELGFAPATQEIDASQGAPPPVDLKVNTATLAAINQAAEAPAQTVAGAATSAPKENAQAPAPGAAPATPAAPSAPPSRTSTSAANTPPNGRGGRGQYARGRGAGGQGGAQNSFAQVGLNGEAPQNPAEVLAGQQPGAENQLGEAASADAVQMMGTVALGAVPEQLGGLAQFGPGGAGGLANAANGAPGGITGEAVLPGAATPGGAPGGAGFIGGGPGGGGGRGGGGGGRGFGGGRGGPGGRGPQGVAALYGVQRLLRQRINTIHYSVYDQFSDSALNAEPYALTGGAVPRIPGWTETAGMNIGGPLKIPHVYDGSDKTFFYVNFGGGWSRNPLQTYASVPTAAERLGDFSGDNVVLYNPSTGQPLSNQGCAQDLANAPGTCIPTGMINPVSQALLQYIPLPNLPGQTLNYRLQAAEPGSTNRLNVNVTQQITRLFSAQVNYNLSDATTNTLNSFPELASSTSTRGQAATLGLTQNYTKTFLNTTQLYYSRQRVLGTNVFSDTSNIASELGIAGVSGNPLDYGLPQIGLTNFTGLNLPNPSLARSQTYRLVDQMRWLKTKHTISLGGELRRMDIDRDTDPAPNGSFSFTGLMTSLLTGPQTPASSATCPAVAFYTSTTCSNGNDFADFLLGTPANLRVQYGDASTYFHNYGYVGYVSDDWHVLPKLTVTYGVRYEAFTPPEELENRIVNLNVSPGFSSVQCVTPLVAVGNCVSSPDRSLFHGSYNNWAPRLGIAWQPPGSAFSGNHQMTIRAGFATYYVESYLNTLAGEMANQPPFAVANTAVNVATAATPLTFQNGLQAATAGALTNTVAVNPYYHVPYAMIWNTSIEYTLFSNTFLEAMYTGTRGVHLDQLFGYSLASSGAANVTSNATGFTYDTSGGISNFNALQVRLQKRLSHGLTFTARYTYSKSLDDASSIGGASQTVIQDNADPRGDYGLSTFNMTHQFFGLFTYQLPFGERQRFFRGGWKESLFGNWRVNSSFTVHSGAPYTILIYSKNPACQNVPGINSERANLVGGYSLANPTVQEWFNTAAFAAPSGCFGDEPRNYLIGPGAFTINSGLDKTIQFGRDGLRRLDINLAATNILNHVNYSGLSTVYGSSTFGEITSVGAMRSVQIETRLNF